MNFILVNKMGHLCIKTIPGGIWTDFVRTCADLDRYEVYSAVSWAKTRYFLFLQFWSAEAREIIEFFICENNQFQSICSFQNQDFELDHDLIDLEDSLDQFRNLKD